MEPLLKLFEDCVSAIRDNRTEQVSNYIQNQSIPARIRIIIRNIDGVVKAARRGSAVGRSGEDATLLLVALSKFTDDLKIGMEDCGRDILLNEELPQAFRDAVGEISSLIQKKDEQLNSLLDDAFFYKDIFNAVLDDKVISEDELNMRENIAEDKRKKAWLLLQKVEELRNGKKSEGMHRSAIKQQLETLEKKVEFLEGQHAQDLRRIEQAQKKKSAELLHKEADLRDAIGALKKLKAESQIWKKEGSSLREQLGQVKKENEMLQESLSSKMMESGQFIAEKDEALQAIKQKEAVIEQLKRSLNEQSLQLERIKKSSIQERQKIQRQSAQKMRQQQSLYASKGKYEASLKMLAKQRERNTQKDARIKQLEEQLARRQHEHSMRQEADNELVRVASSLVENSRRFNEIYESRRGHSNHASSILSESVIMNDSWDNPRLSHAVSIKQERVQLHSFLRRSMEADTLTKLANELPKCTSVEVVYRFPEEKSVPFKEKLKGKNNLLLVCRTKTEEGVVCAFSASGFIHSQDNKDPSTFLFCARRGQSLLLRVKQGKKSMTKDEDYLIFGDEQLCLQQGSDYATIYFQPANLSSLCFEGSIEQREQFLQIADCHSNTPIMLSRYDILQLVPE